MDSMKRLLAVTILAAASVLSLGACNKPSEDSCRKALANMQRLMGTENVRDPAALEGEVRRCKGGSKKAAVDCAIKAQTFDELKQCKFYDLPDSILPSNLRNGSAATGTGSAMSGSGAAGSAMSGSASGSTMSGSAGSPDMGSAAGSAAMGSAAGSAAMGSAAGSAAMGSAAMGSAAGSNESGSAAKTGAGAGSAAKTGAGVGSAATKGTGAGSAAKTGAVKAKADAKKALDSADPMEGGQ
jgi:hypothetical protein